MALAKVTVTGRFLCTKDYPKRDPKGKETGEIVHQVLIFDGDNAVKICGVDGSKFVFGDEILVDCDIYSGDYGVLFRASDTSQ